MPYASIRVSLLRIISILNSNRSTSELVSILISPFDVCTGCLLWRTRGTCVGLSSPDSTHFNTRGRRRDNSKRRHWMRG